MNIFRLSSLTIKYYKKIQEISLIREERKMEMIMAFGTMEKNNARKRYERETSSSVPEPEKRGRRSNSIKVLSTHNHIIPTKYFYYIR